VRRTTFRGCCPGGRGFESRVLPAQRSHLTGARHIELSDPEIVHDDQRTLVPLGVRTILGLADVSDFMILRRASASAGR
jgi:hypothetical protein